jgi:hypothetical protein
VLVSVGYDSPEDAGGRVDRGIGRDGARVAALCFLPTMRGSIRSVAVMVVAGRLVAGIPVLPVVSLHFSSPDPAIGRSAAQDRARRGALTTKSR